MKAETTDKGLTIRPLDSWRCGEEIVLVNPDERDERCKAHLVSLGAYGWTRLLVWGRAWDDVIDIAAEWCAKHAPGLLCDDAVEEEYQRALIEIQTKEIPADHPVQPTNTGMTCGACGLSWDDSVSTEYTPVPAGRCPFEAFHLDDDDLREQAREQAEIDTIATDCGHYLAWEVNVQGPLTRADLLSILNRPAECYDRSIDRLASRYRGQFAAHYTYNQRKGA